MKNINLAAPLIQRKITTSSASPNLLLLGAEIALLLNNRSQFQNLLNHIQPNTLSTKPLKAKYLYLSALNNLYLTDMLTASQQCSNALKTYQKLGFIYEEAECYQTLAQIYRISGVYDVAFTMLKEAEKIYIRLNILAKIAEIKSYFGLTEIGHENFDTALQYLTDSEEIADRYNLHKTQASIYNWLGLVYFLKKDIKRAEHFFHTVATSKQTPENEAYALEMLSRINIQKKNYTEALSFAQKAYRISQNIADETGIFENLYLQAEILYTQQKYSESEHILTELIRRKSAPSATFYPANAYTLLGLINFKKSNYSLAETLFKQAADLEHGKNRLKGAAIDYNNLAELAHRRGHTEEAEKYLKQALSYAQNINDPELIATLSAKLK